MIGIARQLSYAGSLPGRWQGVAVRVLEWASLSTPRLLWRLRGVASGPLPDGLALCDAVLDALGIDIRVEGADHIPRGAVVAIANHPSGVLDGAAVLVALGRARGDVRIMARALAGDMPQIAPLILPVPYDHAQDRRAVLTALSRGARAVLAHGGVVALFPAGGIEHRSDVDWTTFGVRLAAQTGASILPIRILDKPSRLYRLCARLHPVLRQGVLLHEVLRRADRPMCLRIGAPLQPGTLTPEQARQIVLSL